MKKIICLISILFLLVSLVACSGTNSASQNNKIQRAVETLFLYGIGDAVAELSKTMYGDDEGLKISDVAKNINIDNCDCEIIYNDTKSGFKRYVVFCNITWNSNYSSFKSKEKYAALLLEKEDKFYAHIREKIEGSYYSFMKVNNDFDVVKVKGQINQFVKILDGITNKYNELKEIPIY